MIYTYVCTSVYVYAYVCARACVHVSTIFNSNCSDAVGNESCLYSLFYILQPKICNLYAKAE